MATKTAASTPEKNSTTPEEHSTALRHAALPPAIIATMRALIPHIPALLPADITSEQFRAALYLELAGHPALHECTAESLRECAIKAATYGLLPGRDCHFLPFGNKQKGGRKDATYVPNYFGIILALERSGKMRRAFAHPVHEGDQWEFNLFSDRPVHIPAETRGVTPGKELFYYGAILFKDGSCAFETMTLEDIEATRKRAPAHDSGPWVTDRVMMARKTALKRVAKYVHLTPQVRALMEEDAERELQDIPLERHRQNIVDLFGDDPRGSTLPQPQDPPHATPPSPSPTPLEVTPLEVGWRGILRAHIPDLGALQRAATRADDADTLERLDKVFEQVDFALSPLSTTTESEGIALAAAVLEWVDQH